MRDAWRGVAFTTGVLVVVSACATVTYPGPRLPADRVANIEAREVAIDWIDDVDVRGKTGTFEVTAGPHTLVVRLAQRVASVPLMNASLQFTRSSGPTILCVSAMPKHFYVVEPKVDSGAWQPVISDGASDVQAPPCSPTYQQAWQTGFQIAPRVPAGP